MTAAGGRRALTAKSGALIMAALLALYLALVGWRAVQFMGTGEPVAIVIGIALLVLPIIAAWALWRELAFGIRSQELIRRLHDEGGTDLGLPLRPSGRADRDAADAEFGRFKAEVEAYEASWRAWLRLGLAYDAAGDRRRARQAVRTAIELDRRQR
ncbi:tetratricopeptide repeat protein [Agromyces sp. NPDC055658]